jgi:hypothetical protein
MFKNFETIVYDYNSSAYSMFIFMFFLFEKVKTLAN